MKKITLVIFAFLLSFSAFAQFPEGFEGTWTTGSGPAGWAIINAAGPIQTWQRQLGNDNFPARTGSYAAFINRENVPDGTTSNDWLITPEFTVPSNAQLKFWSRLTLDGDQGTVYKIFIGNSTTDITQFTELQSWTELTLNTSQTTYELKEVNIPATYTGQSLRLAFVMQGDNGDRWLVDDVDVVAQCYAPTDLGATGITGNTAGLTWTDAASSGAWEIEVLPANGTPTGAGVDYSGALPYTAPGLTPSTSYVYYVRSKCAPAGNNSTWAGPFAFTTTQIPAQLDWSTDFETAETGFTIVNGTQTNKWVIGTATSNSPTHSLYISNTDGATNAYNVNNASVVHAYRDVFIPNGTAEIVLTYDWKNVGEGTATGTQYDYIRVWSTPASYTPAAGTQTTAVNNTYVNHSGQLLANGAWTTNTHTIDVAAYQGNVRRFIFEWRNDGSLGSSPPGAVDNINFTRVSCPQPRNLTTTALNMNTADLAWTEVGSATQWQVYVVPVAGAAPNAGTTGVTVDNTPAYTAPGLTPGTAYKYYVRSVCGTGFSGWSGPFNFNTNLCDAVDQCTYTFNLVDSFGDGWSGNTMSVRQNGITIATLTLPSGGSATQTVTVCTNNPFTLFWNSGGTFPAEVGVSIVNNFGQVLYTRTPGGTGTQNSTLYTGAVDCALPACLAPEGVTATTVGSDSATFTWAASTANSWEYIILPAGSPAPTDATPGTPVSTNTAVVTDLDPNTRYNFYVRAICNEGVSTSLWASPLVIVTTQIPAPLDFFDDFEGAFEWGLVNGTQTNKWFHGTAVSQSPTHSLYVTNNNGVSNAYSHTTSTVFAYRDIAIPAGYNDGILSFDWKGVGENNWDDLTVFLVPTTFNPTAGTAMTAAGSGGIQVVRRSLGSTWTTYTSDDLDISGYAGRSLRLVFQWRNDGGGGTNPPSAVDNVSFRYQSCPRPKNVNLSCLTNEAVNITWSDPGNVNEWQVAVQPAASPAPTSGAIINVNDYTYEGTIQQDTNYTAYVRSLCPDGSGYSEWATYNFKGPKVSVGDAQALCAGILSVPQQSSSGPRGEGNNVYGQVGCLGSTPNPTWYYLTLSGDGAVRLNLSQVRNSNGTGIDVDFAIFGPFEDKEDACSRIGLQPNESYIVDCSFSTAAVEQVDFTGNAGDVFALLVTNFNGDPGNVTITQTSGPALSCNPTVSLGQNKSFCETDSYNLVARVDNPGEIQVYTYTWFKDNEPYTPTVVATTADSQTIAVTDAGSHIYTVVVTVPVPTSPTPITDTVTIALSHQYTAPVYAPIEVCSSTGSTTDVDININYLGTLDPALYNLVGVYPTYLDVSSNTNALDVTLPYNTGTRTIYAVIADTQVPNCKKIVPLQINVTEMSGVLNYNAAYCTSDAPAPSGLVQVGGNPGSYVATPAGLTIDATTGVITPGTSTPGTYHITYTIPALGGCAAVPVEDDVEIILTPVATTIDYPGAYCNTAGTTAVVTLVGTPGGTFVGDAGLVIDTTTGNVDLGASTPGIHQVTYNIPAAGSCVLPPVTATIEINAQLTGTFDYPRATYCSSEGAVTVTNFVGSLNGTYLATPAGLTINPATGEIDLASSTAGTYDVVYHFDATASCLAYTSPAFQITVVAQPVTTVTYDGPYCNTPGVIGTPTVTGTQGGVFSGDAGLVIDATTGIIDLGTSTGGIHVITYTPPVTAAPCTEAPITITTEINAQLSGTFDYPRALYCSSEGLVQVTNFAGSINGTYLATPAGLDIDPATGEIDLANSTAGTYDIVYHFDASNSCLAYTSPVFQLTVVTQPVTTIDYGTAPFCNVAGFTANVTLTGTQGGVFSATPAGLAINPTTGEIDLGTTVPNTYTVSYAPPATGPCTEAPLTASVVVSSSLSATIAYASAVYCSDAAPALPTQTGNTGGVYEFTPAGLAINPATGEIDFATSTAGTYTITYHIPAAGACGDFFSVPVTVEVIAAPDTATAISYANAVYCSNAGLVTPTITGTQGGTFAAIPNTLVINPATGEVDTANSPYGTYQITYTTPATAPCTPVTTPPFALTINEVPVANISYAGSPYCSNEGMATVTLTGSNNAGGSYSSAAGLRINATTGEIDLALSDAGTYQVVYTITGPAGCGVITSAPATVVITKLPIADFTYATLIICNAAGQPVITPTYVPGGVAGTFTVDHSGLTIDPNTGNIDPVSSVPGIYVITNTIIGTDGCVGNNPVSAPVTVEITPAPVADFSYAALAFCQASTTTASPSLTGVAGTFSATPAGLVINTTNGIIDVAASTPGIYEVINTVAATTDCPAVVSTPVFVTITSQPVITTKDGCVDNEYQLVVSLDGDPVYSVEDVDIVWTATTASGTVVGNTEMVVVTQPDTYYVTVTPKNASVCSVVLPVPVANTMCNIQKGISPGGTEGKNDNFDLTGLDVRKISIFNRYGKEVYKFEGTYTNQWHGQTGNNEELPTGTYFYTIYRANGESRTGWIYVNRDVK
jgi:gliding motility-associated-like protein